MCNSPGLSVHVLDSSLHHRFVMAQRESTDQSSCCLGDQSSYLERSQVVKRLMSHTPTMNVSAQLASRFPPLETNPEQDSGGLEESSNTTNQPEDGHSIDISSVLKSVAINQTWDLGKTYSVMPKMFSLSTPEEDDSVAGQKQSSEGTTDVSEGRVCIPFQPKYMNNFPLYQHYWLKSVRSDPHLFKKPTILSQLLSPHNLHERLTHFSPGHQSEAVSPVLRLPRVSPPTPIKVTPSTLWQDLDEVKASGLLSTLTTTQIRLQETIFELMGSEASYLRSLRVAVNLFFSSEALKHALSQMEHHILFSNIQRLMATSERFLMDLELRLGESVFISDIGDIVLQHCPAFHSLYVPYVTNMMYQEALFNQLQQHNKEFIDSLKTLERDPVCQRQSFKSFLVLPFQRITRIRLILESILKLTEPESDSFQSLEKAIKAIDEVVRECDNGVEKMKQMEELIYLETLLHFGKVKSVPLVISGRFLVREGPVRQLKVDGTNIPRTTFIGVYIHLLSDLLIISSKRDEQFIVLDHAEFPTQVCTEHLNTQILGLPSNSFVLHLLKRQTGQPTAMILLTDTSSTKDTWMKALSSKHC